MVNLAQHAGSDSEGLFSEAFQELFGRMEVRNKPYLVMTKAVEEQVAFAVVR
jgi:hypothetical protein